MRFKATFTDRGLNVLDKGFLPAFEKFGKTVQVLLGPDEVHFVQTPINTDGPNVTARLKAELLFEPTAYLCKSRHHNLIAFTAEVSLLLRVLRAAISTNADALEVKLSTKELPVPGDPNEKQLKPHLFFTGRGNSLSMVQEMPISKPYNASEIDKLVDCKDVRALSPYYVDLQPCALMLQSMVDRMRSVSDTLMFALCKNGDVHVNVTAVNVLLGTQVRELMVYPQHLEVQHQPDRSQAAEQQLEDALQAKEAVTVLLQQKHLSRSLAVAALTTPSQILCGAAPSLSYVHIMYVFKDPAMMSEGYDDSMHLTVRLPAKDG